MSSKFAENAIIGTSSEYPSNSTDFFCVNCKLSVKCRYGKLELEKAGCKEECFYMRNPFEPPDFHKSQRDYAIDDFLVIGANCYICNQQICVDEDMGLTHVVLFHVRWGNIALQPMDYGLGGGYGGRLNNGAYGLYAAAICADTVDCYSGQICQAGRCIFQTAGIGYPEVGYGSPYGRGSLYGYGLGGFYSPYFGMNSFSFSACGSIGCPFGLNCMPGRCLGTIPPFLG
uniref:Cysteine-rich DPF motif domain-containing protein 1 n=1 Tax=Meloidogyne javanica TaxID=6303 RepID=A0A915MRL6_MELJA